MQKQFHTDPSDSKIKWRSSRHSQSVDPTINEKKPRLGRRESEPHSHEITYLYDVLSYNFPNDRVMWDLHHYFTKEGIEYDIQFDVSFFPRFSMSELLPSFRSSNFDNRVPALAINILSKSTYLNDVGLHADICRLINIPIYVIFCSHPIGSNIYTPPFLRVYMQDSKGTYIQKETRKIALREGEKMENIDVTALIDITAKVPFRLGLMERKVKYFKNKSVYRLILVHPTQLEIYWSKAEIFEKKYHQEKMSAEQEKTRADKLETELARYKENKTSNSKRTIK